MNNFIINKLRDMYAQALLERQTVTYTRVRYLEKFNTVLSFQKLVGHMAL